jgi:hypothetical protein
MSPDVIVIEHGGLRVEYRRRHDLEALHDSAPPPQSVMKIGENIFIVPSGAAGSGRRWPVYVDSRSESLAVPTGRAFIRFEPSTDPQTRESVVREAGFRIANVPAYARDAAWVEPLADAIGDALARHEALFRAPGVVGGEPELLRESK